MNSEEFQRAAEDMAYLLVNYTENQDLDYTVLPDVEQGFLIKQIPKNPPNRPEKWADILKDTKQVFLPGLTHWQHSRFYAYFPSSANYEGVLASIITGVMGVNSTSWAACPAAVELEVVVADWLGRALGLPKKFLHSETDSIGGGTLMHTASEIMIVTMMAAKRNALKYLQAKEENRGLSEYDLVQRLVAYTSCEAHSCFEKAAMVCMVTLRVLEVDEKSSLRGETVLKAIEEDIAQGLHPFYVGATVGTTGSTGVDNLVEIGQVTDGLPALWYHVDGAYGGNSFICPEMRIPGGLDRADSFNINPNKWMSINFEAAMVWTRSRKILGNALLDNEDYADPENRNKYEMRHTSLTLGRKFKSIKHWMTLRSFGLEKLQTNIRLHCKLAKAFEKLVRKDPRFEVVNEVTMGLVCFRLVNSDRLTEMLINEINKTRELHMVPSTIQKKFVIRFALTNDRTTLFDIDYAWSIILDHANRILYFDDSDNSGSSSTFSIVSLTIRASLEMEKRRFSTLIDESTPTAIPPKTPRFIHDQQIQEVPRRSEGAYKPKEKPGES